jgi:vacuolar iron transporter family protein
MLDRQRARGTLVALGAWAGGAPIVRPALRVGFWGASAMAATASIGALIGKI